MDGQPLQPSPLPFVVLGANDDDDQVRLIVVQVGQADTQIAPSELGLVELVVEDAFLAEAARENLGDFGYELALFTHEGEGDAETLGLKGSAIWSFQTLRFLTSHGWHSIAVHAERPVRCPDRDGTRAPGPHRPSRRRVWARRWRLGGNGDIVGIRLLAAAVVRVAGGHALRVNRRIGMSA